MFKALALGASAVLIGRPYVYGLAIAGSAGVREVLENLGAEFELTMGSGRVPVGERDRSRRAGSRRAVARLAQLGVRGSGLRTAADRTPLTLSGRGPGNDQPQRADELRLVPEMAVAAVPFAATQVFPQASHGSLGRVRIDESPG